MNYIAQIIVIIEIYIMLGISLNLVGGYSGILTLCTAAFYGLGAYICAIMAINYNTNFAINVVITCVSTGIIAFMVGNQGKRMCDEHFLFLTVAFQIIISCIFKNWIALTKGPMGITGIPNIYIFGLNFDSSFDFVLLAGIFCGFSFWVCMWIVNSPFGRILKTIREDEVFALAGGKNVGNYKVIVFVVGSLIASVAGALYAHYITFIDPSSFTVMESIFILSIVIIGGAGSLWGPVVGAVVLVSLPEILRFVGMPSSVAANLRQIIYGALLVVFMMWRPQGLLGQYSFQKLSTKE